MDARLRPERLERKTEQDHGCDKLWSDVRTDWREWRFSPAPAEWERNGFLSNTPSCLKLPLRHLQRPHRKRWPHCVKPELICCSMPVVMGPLETSSKPYPILNSQSLESQEESRCTADVLQPLQMLPQKFYSLGLQAICYLREPRLWIWMRMCIERDDGRCECMVKP